MVLTTFLSLNLVKIKSANVRGYALVWPVCSLIPLDLYSVIARVYMCTCKHVPQNRTILSYLQHSLLII